jgi:fructan beta-fructosidase
VAGLLLPEGQDLKVIGMCRKCEKYENSKLMQRGILILFTFFLSTKVVAQDFDSVRLIKTKTENRELPDSFRLDYHSVYENMHYNQPLRPQVHYTPMTGQIADPTGLIRYNGIYHLFYMFDEWSKQRGENKNWGHAVSSDCIHWEQQAPILNTVIDNRPGSGSGIVDWNNTLQLQTGIEKTLAIFYTDYKRGISLAFSRDGGKTWIRHKNNPLLPIKTGFRDPMVFWYKPDQSWRMAIYEEPGISFYKSVDLLKWQFLSSLYGYFECPDILQMPVDGNDDMQKWVLVDGNGAYILGTFDGTRFLPEGQKQYLGSTMFYNKVGNRTNYYTRDIYATQTFKNSYEGDGPIYQMAFLMIKEAPAHDRTWSQQLIFPVELTLKTIDGQIRLCRNPIDGIKQLRHDPKFSKNIVLHSGENALENIKGDVLEILTEIDLGESKGIVFDIRGTKAYYNTNDHRFLFMGSEVIINPKKNIIKLRFIIDRNSVEIYSNFGEVTVSRLFYPEESNMNLTLTTVDGNVTIKNMEVYHLESIWLKREQELGYMR